MKLHDINSTRTISLKYKVIGNESKKYTSVGNGIIENWLWTIININPIKNPKNAPIPALLIPSIIIICWIDFFEAPIVSRIPISFVFCIEIKLRLDTRLKVETTNIKLNTIIVS